MRWGRKMVKHSRNRHSPGPRHCIGRVPGCVRLRAGNAHRRLVECRTEKERRPSPGRQEGEREGSSKDLRARFDRGWGKRARCARLPARCPPRPVWVRIRIRNARAGHRLPPLPPALAAGGQRGPRTAAASARFGGGWGFPRVLVLRAALPLLPALTLLSEDEGCFRSAARASTADGHVAKLRDADRHAHAAARRGQQGLLHTRLGWGVAGAAGAAGFGARCPQDGSSGHGRKDAQQAQCPQSVRPATFAWATGKALERHGLTDERGGEIRRCATTQARVLQHFLGQIRGSPRGHFAKIRCHRRRVAGSWRFKDHLADSAGLKCGTQLQFSSIETSSRDRYLLT